MIQNTDKSKTFESKLYNITCALNKIKNKIDNDYLSINFDQEDLAKIDNFKSKIIEIIQFLENDKEFKLQQNQNETTNKIQDSISVINNEIKNINAILKKYELLDTFDVQLEALNTEYNDQFTNPTSKSKESFKENKKSILNPNNDTNDKCNEDNIKLLNQFDQYKLNESDYKKNEAYFENDLFICYNGERKTEDGEKLRITKLLDKKKFKRLFSILTTIHHPYLETFVGANINESDIEIATLKSGANLWELIFKEPEIYDDSEDMYIKLNKGDRTIIAFKVAQAMAYLHSRGIIHRNLSSGIIFIKKIRDENNDEKYDVIPIITNFAHSHLRSRDSILTMTNINANSLKSSFIAPELIDNSNYDEKVDVFAFGGLLFELLTNRSPKKELSKTDDEIWKLIKDGKRPKIPKNCPKDLKELIEACWNRDQHSRPSFVKIINFMLQRRIIIPSDLKKSQEINEFYDKNLISTNIISDCLDSFDFIKNKINLVSHYKSEFLRAQPIIGNYQYKLQTSKYRTQKNFTDEEKEIIHELKKNLDILDDAVHRVSLDRWYRNALSTNVDLITNQLNSSMELIYQSLKKLGINDIEKYNETENDLILDYLQISKEFQLSKKNQLMFIKVMSETSNFNKDEIAEAEENVRNISEKEKEIDIFLSKHNLDEEKSDEVLITQIKHFLDQFNLFELNEDDYEIEKEISNGATSIVYKGNNKKTNQEVAIKALNKSHLKSGLRSLTILNREIYILTRLNHKNIAKFHGYVIPKNRVTVWLIFEYFENGSVYSSLDKFDSNQKIKIALEIAETMEYIHSERIIHRDLKTGNVLFDDDCSPKIIDFGYSISNINDVVKTINAGTSLYMAPEVKESGNYGFEADVFSFGVFLWELEKGKGITTEGLKFGKKFPAALKKLILMCFRKDPKKRPSFSEIIELMMKNDNYIMFSGSNKEYAEEFYEEKRLERKNLNL